MSTIDPKKIAFRGTTNRDLQKHIDSYFTTLGGINPEGLNYTSSDYYYFIDNSGKIIRADKLPKGYIFQLHNYLNIMKNQEDKIPEYVECIEEAPFNYYGKIGTVYKVSNWNFSTSDCILEGTNSGSTSKRRFKPSTKEAYEVQNTYLKSAEYIPQVGDYVVMEKAGGWGYSPDNNGCLAIISQISNRVIEHIKGSSVTFSISGEVINPNKDRAVKFSDIPQFGYGKEAVFRKALPHEIPGSNVKTEPQQQVAEWSKGTYAVGIKGNFHTYSNFNQPVIKGKVYIIEKGSIDNKLDLKDSCYWAYKENFKWFATKEEAIDFSIKIKEDSTYPVLPESAFPVKAIEKQIKKNKFQEVHEIKTVEEKLLKKTKSKLFNI